jgi:hypothetical protein
MPEEPLFNGAKWTAHDRTCLVREVLAGGDWPARAAERLGRTPGGCLHEARRMLDRGPVPIGFREAVYGAYALARPPRAARDAKPPIAEERLRRSFAAVSGRPVTLPNPEPPNPSSACGVRRAGCEACEPLPPPEPWPVGTTRTYHVHTHTVAFASPVLERVLRGLRLVRDVD